MGISSIKNVRYTKKLHRFFKVLVGDFLDCLCIPPAFVHHVFGKLPSTVMLKTNSQATWSVQLLKTEKGVWFGEGWKKFAEHHKLQEEDFLLFAYNTGKKHFKVTIFTSSGLERKFTFEEAKPEEVEEETGKSRTKCNIKTSKKTTIPLMRTNSRLGQEFVPDKVPCSCLDNLPQGANGLSHGMTYDGNPRELDVVKSENCCSPATEICEDHTIAGGVNENNRGRKSQVQSKSFNFVVKKRHHTFLPFLYIPTSFFRKHVHDKSQVKIYCGNDPNGKTFTLTVRQRQQRFGRIAYINGISLFYKHYKFKVGDQCRFEHIRGSKFKICKI